MKNTNNRLSKIKVLLEQLYIRKTIQTELCPDFMCGLDEEEDKRERIIKLKEYVEINKKIDSQLTLIKEAYDNKLKHLSDISLTALLLIHASVYDDEIRPIDSGAFVPYILGNNNIDKLPELMDNIKNGDLKQYIKLDFKRGYHKIAIINEEILQELFLK